MRVAMRTNSGPLPASNVASWEFRTGVKARIAPPMGCNGGVQMQLKVSDLDVIIADPSATVRKMLEQRVASAGVASIRQVDTVSLAMTEMRRQPPHVAIGALYFDDGTGVDLVQAMRDDVRTQGTAFLCVTSEDDPDKLDPIRQAGLVALLKKPIDGSTLAAALHSTIADLGDEGIFDFEELRVLVVDDSRFSRRHIGAVLGKLGISELTFAEDGLQACRLLQDDTFDLVVTDYNMPNLDGEGLVRFVRTESNQPRVPILMVTSESDTSRLAQVHRHGVSAMCDKPFGIDEVRALIANII